SHAALVLVLGRTLRAAFRLRKDKFVGACLSLCLSVFAMLVFTNSLIGTGGLLLFTAIFSILSAAHWQKARRQSSAATLTGADL
ncbi:glucose-6-phosphate isomerase, partial [Burkholderia pseudomallei]|nr:glucose-6-phosphate isomerase [Burkholderia pseudomallei]